MVDILRNISYWLSSEDVISLSVTCYDIHKLKAKMVQDSTYWREKIRIRGKEISENFGLREWIVLYRIVVINDVDILRCTKDNSNLIRYLFPSRKDFGYEEIYFYLSCVQENNFISFKVCFDLSDKELFNDTRELKKMYHKVLDRGSIQIEKLLREKFYNGSWEEMKDYFHDYPECFGISIFYGRYHQTFKNNGILSNLLNTLTFYRYVERVPLETFEILTDYIPSIVDHRKRYNIIYNVLSGLLERSVSDSTYPQVKCILKNWGYAFGIHRYDVLSLACTKDNLKSFKYILKIIKYTSQVEKMLIKIGGKSTCSEIRETIEEYLSDK